MAAGAIHNYEKVFGLWLMFVLAKSYTSPYTYIFVVCNNLALCLCKKWLQGCSFSSTSTYINSGFVHLPFHTFRACIEFSGRGGEDDGRRCLKYVISTLIYSCVALFVFCSLDMVMHGIRFHHEYGF